LADESAHIAQIAKEIKKSANLADGKGEVVDVLANLFVYAEGFFLLLGVGK
jgi:hypothetical protein